MLSYWEQQSFLQYDHIIVGSGIVGLSTAIELKDRFPGARILVLERGLLPTGASSRNAGFACMGSLTELLDDSQYSSEAQIVELFDQRKKGLERLRNRLGDATIGYAQNGSYELISNAELGALDHIDRLNELLLPITQKPAFRLASQKIKPFGFSENYTKALIENTCEGELHTGKMLRALSDLATSRGIEIKTGAEVTRFDEYETHVAVSVSDPLRGNDLVLHTNSLSLCTNAFTTQLLPGEDVTPGRGQVLVTQPIPGLKFKGVYHFDKGYYYFREIDGRVLLGGGRNLDFEGETTTDIALNSLIQIDLEQKLHDIIIPGVHYHIEMRWAGIMAFGATKQPIVKAHSKRIFGAYRMGGMGVALGSLSAMQLADIIQSHM
ncbi:NAD(P)/FAD-dependent oxidoreductase [Polluticoccus soli]|uniref:NAD(P)/FAD-dependent oxidoreductase n=1 Tax=Polluticoccus soli TaxID=3034150 RepID=UPI0023E17F8F|nr:FAD-dependent oxidoreductase [Flavipsychrobacter sp. JY13-12]